MCILRKWEWVRSRSFLWGIRVEVRVVADPCEANGGSLRTRPISGNPGIIGPTDRSTCFPKLPCMYCIYNITYVSLYNHRASLQCTEERRSFSSHRSLLSLLAEILLQHEPESLVTDALAKADESAKEYFDRHKHLSYHQRPCRHLLTLEPSPRID